MTKAQTIHLGFEVGTGEPVAIPLSHMCVTGQTQLSGKTTTLEALISRSKLKAVAFVTKRGEGAFGVAQYSNGEQHAPSAVSLQPFFRHKADWQFVGSLLGAVLNEKLKYERFWLMKICRGAKSLADVRKAAQKWLDETRKSEDVRVLTTILAYFDLFMDELEALPFTAKLALKAGLNVMDLSAYSLPLQMLVISAVVEEVYENHTGVVTLIPEAWEFIPNGKNSPAKAAVRGLIRKGGGLKNFVWIDSQDLAGVDPEVRRQASAVLLLGVQRDQNEVKRTLDHIPRIPAKLKVEDIMTLEKGQFWVAYASTVKKVYVQPAWMTEELAKVVALGGVTELPSIGYAPREYLEKVLPLEWQTLDKGDDARYKLLSSGKSDLPELTSVETVQGATPMFQNAICLGDSRPQSVIDSEAKEIAEMDQRERENYKETIASLERQVDALQRAAANFRDANAGNQQIIAEYEARSKTNGRLNEQVKRLTDAQSVTNANETLARLHPSQVFENDESPANGVHFDSPWGDMSTAQFDRLVHAVADRVVTMIPTNGVVKVEPREVVLKRFAKDEIKRVMDTVESRSVFQKQLIAFLEARGQGVKKATAITAITGKRTANMVRDCKVEYEEIRELAALGFIREDVRNAVAYPNLGVGLKRRMAEFEPSDEDIDAVIGQVMLKLK